MTKEELIKSALDCARDKIYALMTRDDVAKYAGVAPSLVSHYLGSMESVRNAVMEYAVEVEDHHVMAQGVLFRHPALRQVSTKVRHRIIQTLKSEGYGKDV